MTQIEDAKRFARNLALFGAEGQSRLRAAAVAIIGLGGTGCHVAQQLAYLGTRRFLLVDPDVVEPSNLNRLVGATASDVGMAKTSVAERLIHAIEPAATVEQAVSSLDNAKVTAALVGVDYVFGCVDNDAPRLLLTDLASRNRIPYIDLASDTGESEQLTWYGGRVFVTDGGKHCLSCARELDQRELALASMTPQQREADERIYGVRPDALEVAGPMVVSINGVVAGLAVTEFMVWVTGLRRPRTHLIYRADLGTVTARKETRTESCYYCDALWRRVGDDEPASD